MDTTFWNSRWSEGKIGFHQSEINKRLIYYWPQVVSDDPPQQVFVPLCGKSLDMLWLHGQGHRVLGVELSARAADAFFTENNLCAKRESVGEFEVFTGTGPAAGLTLLVGDFFAMTAEQVSECRLFYDRASLIALPPAMRVDYARHLATLMPERSRGLLLSIAYNEAKMKGPPFSVPDTEVCELLQENFSLTQLAHFEGPRYVGNLAERGLETLEERVHLLIRNRIS